MTNNFSRSILYFSSRVCLLGTSKAEELNYGCPLHTAFPWAFPAADGSLFHSLPVVAPFDKYIVTGGTWVADLHRPKLPQKLWTRTSPRNKHRHRILA